MRPVELDRIEKFEVCGCCEGMKEQAWISAGRGFGRERLYWIDGICSRGVLLVCNGGVEG